MKIFSICIPTKNRASSHLPELLKSIKHQILPDGWNLEVIICDDGSVAEEIDILNKLVDKYDLDIKLFYHKKSLGVSEARNTAVANCNGLLIADIDDDDILPVYSIKNRIEFHETNDCSWSFGPALIIDKNLKYKIGKDLIAKWDNSIIDKNIVIKKLLNSEIFYYASTRTYHRDALFKEEKLIKWD